MIVEKHHALLRRHLQRLQRAQESWSSRAGVKQDGPPLKWEPHRPDFLLELVPFHDHPLFQQAPEHLRSMALTCGWLAYNEKTVAIESQIISPACTYLIQGTVGDFNGGPHRAAIAQAMVDEAYHILLVVNSCDIARLQRGLQDLVVPQFELVSSMERAQSFHSERWKKILIQVATAIVSETLITDYLSALSSSAEVQPLNRITTEIHRRDEAAHNGIFKELGALLYGSLAPRERDFFVESLASPTEWFADPELDVWQAMLEQIGFPQTHTIINDCRLERQGRMTGLDLSTLEALLAELGLEQDIEHLMND